MIFRFYLLVFIIMTAYLIMTCQSFQLFDSSSSSSSSSLLSSSSYTGVLRQNHHHHRRSQQRRHQHQLYSITTRATTNHHNELVQRNSNNNKNNNSNKTPTTTISTTRTTFPSDKNEFGWSSHITIQHPYCSFIIHILFMLALLLVGPIVVPAQQIVGTIESPIPIVVYKSSSRSITTIQRPIPTITTSMTVAVNDATMSSSSSILLSSSSSLIKKSQQDIDSIIKLQKGYTQLNYLLDHWVEETTICGRSGDNPYITKNGCERTPIKVMDYLGYKSINHPLYKVDKTIRTLDKYIIDDNDSITYYDALEIYMIAAEEGNSMAYISSWGEANPGGGKDRVELFIERAKQNVIQARDSLGIIINILVE